PVFYGNGTRYNDPNLTTKFQVLAQDAVENLTGIFGQEINVAERCAAVHSADENLQVLNISQSDGALCQEKLGDARFAKDQTAFDNYGLFGAPAFVVDCQYITSVRDSAQLQQAICELRPELCASLNTTG
ncbi:MAG: hypothetical protein Q8P02_04025, partial [Candidatus Micrarchaeota archaeon]|nr:hypothetical protein [Candidatus Micrarchaeota archaeon]